MEVTYGVVWREGDQERAAQLAMRDDALVLSALGREPRRIPLEAIDWLEIRPPLAGGRERIVVKPFEGGEVEIESVVDRWILHDLSRRVLRAAYGRGEAEPAWHPGLGL